MVRTILTGQLAAMNEAGDARGVAYVAGRLTSVLETIARVTGELGSMAQSINIEDAPRWPPSPQARLTAPGRRGRLPWFRPGRASTDGARSRHDLGRTCRLEHRETRRQHAIAQRAIVLDGGKLATVIGDTFAHAQCLRVEPGSPLPRDPRDP